MKDIEINQDLLNRLTVATQRLERVTKLIELKIESNPIADVQCDVCGVLVPRRNITKHYPLNSDTFDCRCNNCALHRR